ncbi:XRE family transcriptional regulator [Streptomyces sp. NBC_01453]|uniref:helix-turn-helix domain-containing protein n=1 Tax=Streptomyces sp. NBC_01453 TaxID=2903873 RepID=UPI002E2E1CC2|nr:XRE family transcriptional regulator [Streptomyces sp. NBC_01453]
MLVLARESRNWTQAQVAAAMAKVSGTQVSQGYVSRAEQGRLAVASERLDLYAAALGYPPKLLLVEPGSPGVGVGLVHHRKKASLGASSLRCVHAQLVLARLQIDGLAGAVGHDLGAHEVPRVEVGALTTAKDAARLVRRQWRMPPGPVDDVIAVLEAAGILVAVRELAGARLDAVSQFDGVRAPLVLLAAGAPADRRRFSLAHELGHLVMHHVPDDAMQEKEADAFAAEFLMPARDIRPALTAGVSLGRLAELKQTWRVSMAALLKRAQTLNTLTEWQYRSAMAEMSALGYRTSEPMDLPAEQPHAVSRLIEQAVGKQRMGLGRAASYALLLPEEFATLYAPQHGAVRTAISEARP